MNLKKLCHLCCLFIFLPLVSFAQQKSEIDQRIEKQIKFRVRGWCVVSWKDGFYPAQILELYDHCVLVRIFDNNLSIDDWPIVEFSIEEINPISHKKCESLEELIQHLKTGKVLRTPLIEEAFKTIDRGWFCAEFPYFDAGVAIGCEMLISAPSMHIWALELSKDLFNDAENILDVGTGSGYMAAIFAELCPRAKVTGIDCFDLLTNNAEKTCLTHLSKDLNERLFFVTGNGEQGYLNGAPYDFIYVGFMCEEIPQALVDQLKPGGRLIVPVGKGISSFDARLLSGNLVVINKKVDGSIEIKEVFSCSFIPSQVKNY